MFWVSNSCYSKDLLLNLFWDTAPYVHTMLRKNEFNQFSSFQLILEKWCFNVWILLFLGKTIVGTQVLSMRTALYEIQKKELNVIVSSYYGHMLSKSKMDKETKYLNHHLNHLFPKNGSKSDVKVTIDTFGNILLQKWWVQSQLSVQ